MYLKERECCNVQLITLKLGLKHIDMAFWLLFSILPSASQLRMCLSEYSYSRLPGSVSSVENQGNLKTALFCFRKINEPSMESRGVKGFFRQTHYKLQHTLSEQNCDLEPHTAQCP